MTEPSDTLEPADTDDEFPDIPNDDDDTDTEADAE